MNPHLKKPLAELTLIFYRDWCLHQPPKILAGENQRGRRLSGRSFSAVVGVSTNHQKFRQVKISETVGFDSAQPTVLIEATVCLLTFIQMAQQCKT